MRPLTAVLWFPLVVACLGPLTPLERLVIDCTDVERAIDPFSVPACLQLQGIITESDGARARSVVSETQRLLDSLERDSSVATSQKAAEVRRGLASLTDFYARKLFDDSARFNRILDHVLVTNEYVRGGLLFVNDRAYPTTTPCLGWQYYPNAGIYFQPVNTVNPQFLYRLLPRPSVILDSLIQVTDRLYGYAIWRTHAHHRFPVWEYEFPFRSGGVLNDPPWISSQSQGLALMIFLERFRRTGETVWKDRAFEVFRSYYVIWDHGGILLPDTTHGYWWEEFSPTVRIWNGSAWSVLALGYLSQVTNDPQVKRVFVRGIEALKYYTPEYDTGSWTLYSRTQGYNRVSYHSICITIMDQLFAQSGDPWFKTVADRWRSYVPPPGVK